MVKTALKALLWGVVSWIILYVLTLYGVGLFRGLASGEAGAVVSSETLFILRYAILLTALVIAGFVFYTENKKLNIVVGSEEKEGVKELPKPVFKPAPPVKPAEVPFAIRTMPVSGAPAKPPEPSRQPVFVPKPAESPQISKPIEPPQAPKPQPFWPGKPFSGFEPSKPAEKPQPSIQPFRQSQPSPLSERPVFIPKPAPEKPIMPPPTPAVPPAPPAKPFQSM